MTHSGNTTVGKERLLGRVGEGSLGDEEEEEEGMGASIVKITYTDTRRGREGEKRGQGRVSLLCRMFTSFAHISRHSNCCSCYWLCCACESE